MRSYVEVSKQSVSRAVLFSHIIDTDFGCSWDRSRSFFASRPPIGFTPLDVSHQYSGWFLPWLPCCVCPAISSASSFVCTISSKMVGTSKTDCWWRKLSKHWDASNRVNSAMTTYQLVQEFCHQRYPHILCTLVQLESQCRKINVIYKQIQYLYVPRFLINTLPSSSCWESQMMQSSPWKLLHISWSWQYQIYFVGLTMATLMLLLQWAVSYLPYMCNHLQIHGGSIYVHLVYDTSFNDCLAPTARSVSHSWKNSRHPRRKGLELPNFKGTPVVVFFFFTPVVNGCN